MCKLTKSHLHKTVKTSPKGVLTVYFFEVWNLELTEDWFDYISSHPSVLTTGESFRIKTTNHVADHCRMLNPALKFDCGTIPEDARIRISMSALVNLTYQNKSCLLIQKGVVKPFGGAYTYEGSLPVPSAISDDPKSLDLRFTIHSSEFSQLEKWFDLNQGRETTPNRELIEELSEENKILSPEMMESLLNSLK